MQITEAQLAQVCQAADKYTIARFAPRLTRACHEFDINTPRRMAAFLAQVAHECGEFRWLREIWGPTPQQKKYERNFDWPWPPTADDLKNRKRNYKAWQLGNSEKGDGFNMRGGGIIQTTGRKNIARASAALFPHDPELLLDRPGLMEQPTQACRLGAFYWADNGLNRYADANDFEGLTRRINGGLSHLEQRVRYWRRALSAFHVNETVPTGGAGDD